MADDQEEVSRSDRYIPPILAFSSSDQCEYTLSVGESDCSFYMTLRMAFLRNSTYKFGYLIF